MAFSCPQCQAPVGASALNCPACGVNLAWAAALAERQVLANIPTPSDLPYPVTQSLPRFGEFLLRRGDITEAQLRAALERQREAAARQAPRTVGQILFEMGIVTREQLDQASFDQVKQLQEALQESNRQLEQKVAARTRELQQAMQQLALLSDLKTNFVTNLSHVLRTPLTSIKGYSTLLVSGQMGPLTEWQRKAVETIDQSAARLEETISEILLFSPASKNQMQLQLSWLSLTEMAERLQTFFGPKAAASHLQLQFNLAPGLPPVWADADKIRWALFQLFDQSIKFTPPSGQVTLEARLNGQHVRITIADTAPGLLPDSTDESLPPLPDLPDHQVENTGLGLALVRRIIEAHHAELSLESLSGAGTRIMFELPTTGEPA